MWTATFISFHGAPFTTTESELEGEMTMLEYIKYCTDRKSILVDLKMEN